METRRGKQWQRWIVGTIVGAALAALIGILVLAAFPFGFAKDLLARKIGTRLNAPVAIASIERRELFSLAPTVIIKGLVIAQPDWVGPGEMVRADAIEMRAPILPLLFGSDVSLEKIVVRGLKLALVRDRNGRANWEGQKRTQRDGGTGIKLNTLTLTDGHIAVRDDKRFLNVAGALQSDMRGLRIVTTGRFHDAPAQIMLRGDPIFGRPPRAPYAVRLEMRSPLLALEAQGNSQGALNFPAMDLDISARAPSLKYLDNIIEAGLFGTRPIDLQAKVRKAGPDWHVQRISGSIGRSILVGRAEILKREGRTKIDADMRFSAFDFDDLSDAEGRAKARQIEAQIGNRVLPGTRINISKVGPTDGAIRFRADRLLLQDSAFKSLSGVIRLDGKLLTIERIVAGMASGRMTGNLSIDQRAGAIHPRLTVDLAFSGGMLETLMGTRDATGPLRGRVLLSGAGDTIRQALAHANGRAGLVVRDGTIKRTLAAVLGQDLGKAIGTVVKDKEATVPLRCLAIRFAAKDGKLTPSPFVIDTGISSGRGRGHLSLADETIALSLVGQAHDPSILRLVDPITIGGTFSKPSVSAAGKPPGSKMEPDMILKAVGKSIGSALGIGKDKAKAPSSPAAPVNCDALARQTL